MACVVNSQSENIDGVCTVCYQDKITEKSYQDVATSLHKEEILQEFKSLSDAWKMFQGINVFRKYLGAKIVFELETPPKPCIMCLIKIINLMEASYVMTRTYDSGTAKSGSKVSKTENSTLNITSSRPKRSGGRSLRDRNPDFLIDTQSHTQPSISIVNPKNPVTSLPSPSSSSPSEPAELLKKPLTIKSKIQDKKGVKKRDHSLSPKIVQVEKRVKKPVEDSAQEKQKGPESKTIIKGQKSATVQPSTDIEKWKELRSTYLDLLEKTASSKGLHQQIGSAKQTELQVFEHSQNEDMYIRKMSQLLEFCNKAKTERSNKDSEKATSKNNIKEQNDAKEEANYVTGLVSGVDHNIFKFNNVVEEVAEGKCGFLETSKDMADLISVDKKPKSRRDRKEKVRCTKCGEELLKKAFKNHKKTCSIESSVS